MTKTTTENKIANAMAYTKGWNS